MDEEDAALARLSGCVVRRTGENSASRAASKTHSMIAPHVHALREGDDAAKMAAARALSTSAKNKAANRVPIAEAGAIPLLVELLRDGSAEAKLTVARALHFLAYAAGNRVLIAEAHGIPPLVALLRDGNADAKLEAAAALRHLAYNHMNQLLIPEAGGIPPLVDLLRDGSNLDAKQWATCALRHLGRNNDANQVAIAAALSLEALVELVRCYRVVFKGNLLFSNAGGPAKRKAALVVAALLGGCVPDSARRRVPRVLQAAIGSYL